MRLSKTVDAPASFIFDKLVESSLYDIKQQTGESIHFEALKGYTYHKTFQNKQKAEITITEVVKNETYEFITVMMLREYKTRYQLKALGENSCEIICEEKQVSHGVLQRYNDMIMEILIGWQKKKQMRYMFDGMAKVYHESKI